MDENFDNGNSVESDSSDDDDSKFCEEEDSSDDDTEVNKEKLQKKTTSCFENFTKGNEPQSIKEG